jgi:hypothetical protein
VEHDNISRIRLLAALRQQSKGYRDSDRSLGGRRCAGVEVAEVSRPDRAARRR